MESNQTQREYPRDKCLHQLFEDQAARTPEGIAVVFAGSSLSYQELNIRANQLAFYLRSVGVGPEILVGLCVERSLEMIVALVAILKAGGAYVPLDPNYPAERLAFMLEDARTPVLLTQKKLAARLPANLAKTICLDDPPSIAGNARSATNPENQSTPADLAYVIFTSGSTGRPKGVLVAHHNVVRLMQATADWFQFNARDVWTMFHSYAFDFSVWEIWGALLYGGKLVVVPYFASRSPREFYELLVSEKVTVLNQTPTAFRQLIQAEAAAPTRELSLRHVIFGGEALNMSCLQPWFEHHGDERPRLVNMYGITETTVHVTYRPLKKEDVRGPSVIGVPIPDLEVFVLDPHGQPVPVGMPGELFVGGAGLARGYLNRPELTAERFVPHPFSRNPAARVYRTGDLARRLPGGDLEYLGRVDQQVKIRGHRIELGEIEAVLSRHPWVADCATVVQCPDGEDQRLVAFVAGRKPADPNQAGSLREWLKNWLPDHMIPARMVALPALPLNPNGKVDRKALAKFKGEELNSGAACVAPRTDQECRLAEIWQTVLQRKRIGVQETFFDLGGHSLLAIVICSQVNQRLGFELPLRWVFDYPTIESLAKQMSTAGRQPPSGVSIERADRQMPLPMSFGQQQMWLLQQSVPDPSAYNEAVACRFSGPVDREKIRRALSEILGRHEVLRTAVVHEKEILVQKIAAAESMVLPWQEMDLRAVAAAGKQTALTGQLTTWARQPFDLARAPLWRAAWIELGGEERLLALAFHHSIVDEWSLRLFFKELEHMYATPAGTAAGLPVLPVQYADYAAWERQQLAGAVLERQRDYWREQLRDLPPDLELPADQPGPARPSGQGAVYDFQITGPAVATLRELARQENTTVFTVVLAAFQLWLSRYTGQLDLIVGTPVAHRERPEVQALLGCFLNTLPIRVRLEGNSDFLTLLRQVRPTVLDAFDHAGLPFETMVELAGRAGNARQQPLFQVMFVLLEERLPALRLGQAHAWLMPVPTRTSKCDLILNVQTSGPDWDCQLEYSTDLFTRECAARMAGHFTELLRSIAADPQKPVGQLNLLPEAERRQILVEWNRTEREYPRDKCIHQLFEEQVERTPDAVAVVFGSDSLTYRELNQRANHLADHLRARGVGPEVLVGLGVERSLEMVVALLAILKAGGAYWSVEENLPKNRLHLLLADARPHLLLVRRNSASHFAGRAAGPSLESPNDSCPLVVLEDLLDLPTDPILAPPPPNEASRPAYVSYTSGSTGQPKGVVVPHRGVVRLVKETDYVSLPASEVLLHLSPLSFDASTFELWGALLNGGRVVLMPPGPPALADIGDAVRQHGVTTLWLTAGLFHLMVEKRLDDLRPLRQLLAGGDVLLPEHVRRARRALPECRIINGYGPTENTTFTCCHTVLEEGDPTRSVPIGRPIANTRVYVLDAFRQPVPAGVAGELYAGGDGLACGYLHQPELTAERFVPDPFSDQPGARLYRTGDRVRWRPEGTLEFLGRLDTQVKIRGHRVELGEIETDLRGQPEVQAAIVVVCQDPPDDKRLVAYLVAKTAERPDDLTMRGRLAEKLPEYMLPTSFVWLEQLPLTPNGKIDRQALPAPKTIGNPSHPTVPPINLLEWEFVRIWRQLFQREDIGRQDNFFAHGGHSFLAARLAAEIEKLLGCKMPIAALIQSPTIELLARRFADERWAPPWSSLVPLQPHGAKPPLFFVHGVGGDVFGFVELAGRLSPDQPSYGIQAVGLDGKSARHITVEEMAAHYVREITSFQTEGPFYLVGYSLGGVIAFEIAQQLHRLGRRVALLALLDCGPVGATPWFFYALAMATYVPGRCRLHFQRWMKLPRPEKTGYFRGRLVALRNLVVENFSKPTLITTPPQPDSPPPKLPMDYFHAVALPYQLRNYPGSVDLFVSDEAISGWRWYWRHLVRGGVSFHRIPGRHLEILSPDKLPTLAKSLTAVLQHKQPPK